MLLGLIIPAVLSTSTAERFPPPDGPYNVGITQTVFNHSSPNDPIAPQNVSSILLATIYYPTLSLPNPETTTPYLDPINARIWDASRNLPNGSLSRLQTWTQLDAPFLPHSAPNTSLLPTILFSPGGGSNAAFYTSLLSSLASHGYPVLALDHPGEAPYLPLANEGGVYGVTSAWNRTFATTLYHMRVADTLAALRILFPAYVKRANAPFNTTHFLTLGHSLGGAAAAGAMAREPAILGGVNLDGGFWDEDPDAKGPFLIVSGEEHTAAYDPSLGPFSDAQTGWWRWIEVQGTDHLDFGDFGLWVDLLGERREETMQTLGKIWKPRCARVVSELVLAFFGVVLGRAKDLVQVPNDEFPEVRFVNGSM
ncbi:Alpha/Beta hydrolase protein [Phaeosphaeria sp. MPI-PUGE-AT-0046c]|nr:Alpha/Beta hydrolase protein [Phaeosphaeria sp. MPI-PUGE-AT-0046c]